MASKEAVIPADKPCVKLKWTRMLTMVALFGNTGMFLAGYTTAVQNNAMLPLAENFNLTTSQKEGITASTLLFAAPTSVLSSTLSTAFGRRPVLLMSAGLNVIGGLGCAAAPNYGVLILGRCILGIALGLASATTPMYTGETSPPVHRGRVVGLAEFNVVFGQFVACMICALTMRFSDVGYWRTPMAISVVFALLQLFGQYFLPESPRWLVQQGRDAEAEQVLLLINSDPKEVPAQLQGIREAVAAEDQASSCTAALTRLYSVPRLRRAASVGIMLMTAQQLSGINALMAYSGILFDDRFPREGAMWLASIAVLIQLAGVASCFTLIDMLGRRVLLIVSKVLIVVTLLLLSLAFSLEPSASTNVFLLTSMAAFLIAYGFGLGTIPWIIIAEIFPIDVRAVAVGQCIVMTWLSNFVVAALFLDLCEWMGTNGAFAFFAGMSALCVIGFVRYVPETRGMSLEKTVYLFDDPYPQATCWPARRQSVEPSRERKTETSKLLSTKPV